MRPIDADELPKQEIKDEKEYINPSYARGWNDATRTIYLYARTIEAEPVRRGKWKVDADDKWVCSECGAGNIYAYSWDITGYKLQDRYCPNCGAKMEGGEENE